MKYIKNGKLVLNGTIRECDLQDKLNKALEIITEKQVDVLMIKLTCRTVDEYNHLIQPKWRTLIQEEYDLLKEILL